MASPVVEQVVENSTPTAGTSHTINHPTVVAGELWIIFLDKGTPATTATVNAHSDWTELLDENLASGLYIAYRWTTGSEGASTTLVTSASIRTASMVYRITGAENPATTAPQIGTTATGTSATPDPPASAAPPSSKDYLFVAFAGMAGEEADDDTWGNTPPTNYTPSPPRQKSCGTAGTNLGGLIVAAERALTTGSADNPGTFGVDVSAAWRAQTVTVHPSTAPPPIDLDVASAQAMQVSGSTAEEEFLGSVGSAQAEQISAVVTELEFAGTVVSLQAEQVSAAVVDVVIPIDLDVASSQEVQSSAATVEEVFDAAITSLQEVQTSAAEVSLDFTATIASLQEGQQSEAAVQEVFDGAVASSQVEQFSTATVEMGFSAVVASSQEIQSSEVTVSEAFEGVVASLQTEQSSAAVVSNLSPTTFTVASLQEEQYSDVQVTSGESFTAVTASVQARQTSRVRGFVGPLPNWDRGIRAAVEGGRISAATETGSPG